MWRPWGLVVGPHWQSACRSRKAKALYETMKAVLQHMCRECGYRTVKWFGKCGGCGAFGSVEEARVAPALRAVVPIDQVPLEPGHRDKTGIGELDRALGGGLVPGAV